MEKLVHNLKNRLSPFAPVRKVKGFSKVTKEAAQGAALLAEGLAGGVYSSLIETMDLCRASGTVLDHLYFKGAKTFTKKHLEV